MKKFIDSYTLTMALLLFAMLIIVICRYEAIITNLNANYESCQSNMENIKDMYNLTKK